MNISNQTKIGQRLNPLRKRGENVVNDLYGSLKTNIPYTNIKTVRKKAGVLLGKKYSVNLKRNERRNI